MVIFKGKLVLVVIEKTTTENDYVIRWNRISMGLGVKYNLYHGYKKIFNIAEKYECRCKP